MLRSSLSLCSSRILHNTIINNLLFVASLINTSQFAITMGVFLWLYNMVLLANYVGANYAHREIMPVDMVESKYAKPIDIFLLFMFYTATICISEDSSTYCKAISDSTCSKLSAGATFGWFGSFGIVGSIFLREPAAFTRLVKGLKDESYADIVGPTGSISTGAAPTEQAPQKVVDL